MRFKYTSWLQALMIYVTATAEFIHLVGGNCGFPPQWSGKWFQSGLLKSIEVNTSHIQSKGVCIDSDGQERFLLEDKIENCFRCIIIHEKHFNVLQYKETYCDEKEPLEDLCEKITGDAQLYSMFRLDAKLITCPFKEKPPFTFDYNRGSGNCESPVSRIDSCTDDSRMLLRYQACADVFGSESTVEVMSCLADWKDGSTQYMVAKLEHKNVMTDEERYRCFVWSKSGDTTYIAQSGDATCNGIPTSQEGSKTMRLYKADGSSHYQNANCKFPSWITDHHTWHLLNRSKSFQFGQRNGSMRVMSEIDGESKLEMKAACNSILESSENKIMISAHVTKGCDSGYRCMVFYRRDDHVIELQQSGSEVEHSEEACQNFNKHPLPFITLITSTLKRRKCPFMGRYTLGSKDENMLKMLAAVSLDGEYSSGEKSAICNNGKQLLSMGCNQAETMEFQSECSSSEMATAAYSCHGVWTDSNNTSYLIALPLNRNGGGGDTNMNKYCFVIDHIPVYIGSTPDRVIRGRHLQMNLLINSCRQTEYNAGINTFNITLNADCDGIITQGSGHRHRILGSLGMIISMVIINVIISSARASSFFSGSSTR